MPEQPSIMYFVREAIRSAHPALRLILLFSGMFISLMVTGFLGVLIAMPAFGAGWQEILQYSQQNFEGAPVGLLKFVQTTQSIGFFVIPGLLFTRILLTEQERSSEERRTHPALYLLVAITLLASMPLINLAIHWNMSLHLPEGFARLEEEAASLTEKLTRAESPFQMGVNFLIIALVPALGEELIFRRIIQPILGKWIGNMHWGIIVSALFFSAFHLQFYGFLPRFILGLYFGYLFYWSGRISVAVWAHLLNNSLALLLIYFGSTSLTGVSDAIGESGQIHISITVISLLITVALVWITSLFFARRNLN